MQTVNCMLGTWSLSHSAPPIFAAEIGTFFNKDTQMAYTLLESIATARDRVREQPVMLKGEILHDPSICLPGHVVERYVDSAGIVYEELYHELIARKSLPLDEYAKILNRARQLGLPFALSVYDTQGVLFAHEQGTLCIKLASSNIVHYPLLKEICACGVPVILDDGRASLAEVATAMQHASDYGAPLVILEHSPDGHPAPSELHNLRMLQTYNHVFGVPVGLSDHYAGEEMLYVAVALGASLLEKGIVLDIQKHDQDVSHALPVERLEHVLRKIHDCHKALGLPLRNLAQAKAQAVATSARMAIVAKELIPKGTRLTRGNVTFAFPKGSGVGVEHWDTMQNSLTLCDIPPGAYVKWHDVKQPDE